MKVQFVGLVQIILEGTTKKLLVYGKLDLIKKGKLKCYRYNKLKTRMV